MRGRDQRCAPGRAKRGRVVRGRRRSGQVAVNNSHLWGQATCKDNDTPSSYCGRASCAPEKRTARPQGGRGIS